MENHFQVQVIGFSNIREIEGAWTTKDYEALLDAMEYGDHSGMGDQDLREMCLMSLQDQEPEEAAYLVLKHVVGDVLREGQLRNMAIEMQDEKLWEEYVDPDFHERLFNAGSLLNAAMPGKFPSLMRFRSSCRLPLLMRRRDRLCSHCRANLSLYGCLLMAWTVMLCCIVYMASNWRVRLFRMLTTLSGSSALKPSAKTSQQ